MTSIYSCESDFNKINELQAMITSEVVTTLADVIAYFSACLPEFFNMMMKLKAHFFLKEGKDIYRQLSKAVIDNNLLPTISIYLQMIQIKNQMPK